jgi:uncharacterized protein YbjT (DUF2867 family)
MRKQTAVIIGATGLIGSRLVDKLLADDGFNTVRILVRRPYALEHPKLEVEVVDFTNQADFIKKLGAGDCVFSSIGTTKKKMKGNEAAYRKIDFDIAVNAAKFAKEAGFTQYLLVSSLGANANGRGFYLRLKGEIESAIAEIGFASFHIFRPSFLLGTRNEVRLGETIFKNIFTFISRFLTGSLEKYRAIDAEIVAQAMINTAKESKPGNHIYYYAEMKEACGNL